MYWGQNQEKHIPVLAMRVAAGELSGRRVSGRRSGYLDFLAVWGYAESVGCVSVGESKTENRN